jgi:hypothetical protein
MPVWYICFTDPETGEQRCFWIPVLVIRWPWPEPDPDTWWKEWVYFDDPRPHPWIVDLPVLATLDYLALRMTDERAGLRDQIRGGIRESMNEISRSLPESMQIEFKERKSVSN